MTDKNTDLLDYLIILAKYKKSLFLTALISMLLFYGLIYFFVDEKFDATATIVPVEENSISGLAGMIKDFPIDIGGMGSMNTELTRYNTIIYSRSVLDKVIDKFNLIDVYEIDRSNKAYYKKTLEKLEDNITASEDDNGAYVIKVRDNKPDRAAEITNYLITLLNKKIIDLKIQKSKENRIFLEARVTEVKQNLNFAEDSLKLFQKQSGLFSAEDQIKSILDANAKLETDLLAQQVQLSILEKIRDKNSPEVQTLKIQVSELDKKVNEIKQYGRSNSMLLGLKNLPDKALRYLRLLRNIEINRAILEFILPLYEQARFEEQKDTPILQVVDYAIPPQEKSFPPRAILTLIFGFIVLLSLYSVLLIRNLSPILINPKYLDFKKYIFKW